MNIFDFIVILLKNKVANVRLLISNNFIEVRRIFIDKSTIRKCLEVANL